MNVVKDSISIAVLCEQQLVIMQCLRVDTYGEVDLMRDIMVDND